MVRILEGLRIGRYLVPDNPAAFSGTARVPPQPAPRLGEHTDAILAEIGYSNSEIASLHDDRIVAGP